MGISAHLHPSQLIPTHPLTLHVDGDPVGDRQGEVVVARLAGQLRAQLGAGDVVESEPVLHGAAVAALVAGVDQVAVPPPSHLRRRVACKKEEGIRRFLKDPETKSSKFFEVMLIEKNSDRLDKYTTCICLI